MNVPPAPGLRRHHVWMVAAIVAIALILALAVGVFDVNHPTTDDATIDADVVHVAPAVAGRIITIPVTENARVRKGQLLFQIDPVPYLDAVSQTEADLTVAEAALDTQRRVISTQRSTAIIAAYQTTSARANYELSARTVGRLKPLDAQGYVAGQRYDEAEVTQRDANTSFRQAKEAQAAALQAIDTEKGGVANVLARQAALALARRELQDTTFRAPHDGLVSGLNVSSGEYVIPGQSLFTLINTEQWFAVGNFRETDLKHIAAGDCATVYSMIDRQDAIKGVVQGISWGVLDQDRINVPRTFPYVQRSLNWVRVAQRFPVRVILKNPPPQLMRVGASAVVEVRHGERCR